MRKQSGYLIISFGLILTASWLAWGYSIFFDPSFNYTWARGEAGDFIGGGIGAITVIFIIYSVWLQIGQINSQQNDSFEASVFRMFQALKPEVEGLSVRIISKAIKGKIVIVSDNDEPFSEMLEKYNKGDRTVFLRAMQKSTYCNAIRSDFGNQEFEESIDRFKNIMTLIDVSLRRTVKRDDDDFSKAIKSTEIYETYKKCFLNKPKL